MKSRKDIVLELVALVALAAGIVCLVILAAHEIKPPAPKSGAVKFSDITSGTNYQTTITTTPPNCTDTTVGQIAGTAVPCAPPCKSIGTDGRTYSIPCRGTAPLISDSGPLTMVASSATGVQQAGPHWVTVLAINGNTIFIPGRVTPEEESSPLSLGGHFAYYDLWTHKMSAWIEVIPVSNLDSGGANQGCVFGDAQNVHSWKPRADGCYLEDAGK